MLNTLQAIYDRKLVAVIRGAKPDTIIPVAKALRDGGVNILELTAETPDIVEILRKACRELDDSVIVGAGTVLDPETARAMIMAGAKFVFSPTVNIETIKMTKRYGAISIPGAMTPTEILNAYENGADIVKVFPANVYGPGFLKAVKGPLPQIPLMPTGGVDLDNIQDYFANGAVAAGLGGSLVKLGETVDDTVLKELTAKAAAFRAKITE